MRAPISVVIPVLDGQDALAACAGALMEGVEAGLIRELIVSDGGSSDDTARIADQIGAVWITGPASRGGQLKQGCAVAKGDWLLCLHVDTQLAAGWSEQVAAHLSRKEAGYCKLSFASGGLPAKAVAGWANLRSKVFGLPYGDQGLLIPRALYDKVGGYEDVPLLEDVAIARALGAQLVPLDVIAVTSAQKYERSGWLRRGSRNLWTLARYFAGVSTERLAADYSKP